LTPCCCNPGRGFPTLSIEEMANALDHRGNNRVFVAIPGHCEMRLWREGKASMLEGLRAIGELQLVSAPTQDLELILGGTMRGTFFPEPVPPPPGGMGGGYLVRDLGTPAIREEMGMTFSWSPPARSPPAGQSRSGPSGRRTRRTRLQEPIERFRAGLGARRTRSTRRQWTTWGGPATPDPGGTQQPAGSAGWLAGIRGHGPERSSDTEGDGAKGGQDRLGVRAAGRSATGRRKPGPGTGRTRRLWGQWPTWGGLPRRHASAVTQQPAGSAGWLAGIRGHGAERSSDTEGDGANAGQGRQGARAAVRLPSGRGRAGPKAGHTQRVRDQWPTWGGPLFQIPAITQQPASNAGWLAGIRGHGPERSSDTEGDGANAGQDRPGVRAAERSPVGRHSPGPRARRTRRKRVAPNEGLARRQVPEAIQQPAGSVGWLTGIRRVGGERSLNIEGKGGTSGHRRGEALRPAGWPSGKCKRSRRVRRHASVFGLRLPRSGSIRATVYDRWIPQPGWMVGQGVPKQPAGSAGWMASIRAFGAGWASDSAGVGHACVRGLSLFLNNGERGMDILGVSSGQRVKGVVCSRGGGNLPVGSTA
jgi:hypothetical protein